MQIHLIGEAVNDGFEGSLIRARLDHVQRVVSWAIDHDSNVPFNHWLNDRRWRVLTAFDPGRSYNWFMKYLRYEAELEPIVGAPFRFIDQLGVKGRRTSVAMWQSGELLGVFKTKTDFCEHVRCCRRHITQRLLNGEKFKVKDGPNRYYGYGTAFKIY